MTAEISCPRDLSDHDLLIVLARAAARERQATAQLVAMLMEVDTRKLYAGQGYSSLFTFCVQRLHLSEHAAYLRIEAARSARRFPAILEKLDDGSLHLSAVSLLGPHLTDANHIDLLDAARYKSKRDIELLVARVRPQPDVPSVVRKLPAPMRPVTFEAPKAVEPVIRDVAMPVNAVPARTQPAVIKPVAIARYKVQFTVSEETHEKLRQVQDLMRHTIPSGDPAEIFDRALTLLLGDLVKRKCGATENPRRRPIRRAHSRHIPAAIRREVWRRDEGRCAFRDDDRRCVETGFLEFHHVVPYADGRETSVSNIQLRCRAHNQYEALAWSGDVRTPHVRESRNHGEL